MGLAMKDEHETLMRDWQQNARRNEDADFRFLRSLKMASDPEAIDALAGELHKEAFAKVDCTRCANCCKTMQPGLTDEDINRIASHLGLTSDAFAATYLKADLLEGGLRMKATPCLLLDEDNRCTICEVRPQACREFPHKEGFIWRTYQHSANLQTCPAVYHVVRQLRRRLRRSG
jgi:Fe-S-cluster containining protein